MVKTISQIQATIDNGQHKTFISKVGNKKVYLFEVIFDDGKIGNFGAETNVPKFAAGDKVVVEVAAPPKNNSNPNEMGYLRLKKYDEMFNKTADKAPTTNRNSDFAIKAVELIFLQNKSINDSFKKDAMNLASIMYDVQGYLDNKNS